MKQTGAQRPRRGGIFPFLAILLTCSMILGFFSEMNPEKKLSRALENTKDAILKQEETIGFLWEAICEGSISIQNGNTVLTHRASLPEKALLSLKGEGYGANLTLQGEDLVLESASLFPEVLTAKRSGSAADLEGSIAALPELDESVLFFSRLFLSVTDPDLLQEDTLSDAVRTLWKKAKPQRSTEKASIEEKGKTRSAQTITYHMEKESLSSLLSALPSATKSPEMRLQLISLCRALAALQGKNFSREDQMALESFLAGSGEDYARFSDALLQENAALTLSFICFRGMVKEWELNFLSGETNVFVKGNCGEDESGEMTRSVSVRSQKGEEILFSASASHSTPENSKKAYIREMNFEVYDPEHLLLEEEETLTGKIRYSWGKEKGDVGLRVITQSGEINFRGTLQEYKKGKKLLLTVSRIEVDRVNVLTSGGLTLSVTNEKQEIPPAPEATGILFGEGEEQSALREAFLQKYREIFPEGGTL